MTEVVLTRRRERLHLLAEKMVWWPDRQTLVIADTHFGRPASVNLSDAISPNEMTSQILATLSDVIRSRSIRHCIHLGDLFHHGAETLELELRSLTAWRHQHAEMTFQLIQGNHDRGLRRYLKDLKMSLCPQPLIVAPFVFRHQPVEEDSPTYDSFAGHLHPVTRLGGFDASVPCFVVKRHCILLPSLHPFVRSREMVREPGEVFYAVDEQGLHAIQH